ncbi:MAG: hypothetical protein ACJ75Z_09305 [Solirubrobacterales bacterium]
MSRRSARSMMVAGSLARLSYALGLLLAPESMSRLRLAPAHADAYGRMTTRAFGAVHTNVSLLTLKAALQRRDEKVALALNLGCDLGDLIATLLERRNGDLPDMAAVGSVAVQSTGMAIWITALRNL